MGQTAVRSRRHDRRQQGTWEEVMTMDLEILELEEGDLLFDTGGGAGCCCCCCCCCHGNDIL
jgi:precorrin-6B methylase 2